MGENTINPDWLLKLVKFLDKIQMTYDEKGLWFEAEKLLEIAPDEIKEIHSKMIHGVE